MIQCRHKAMKWWALIGFFLLLGGEIHSKNWNGIVPCVSTRFEAEKLLGRDDTPLNIGIYKYKKLRVHVHYEQKDGSPPEKDIVRELEVYPNDATRLQSFVKNIPDFHKNFVKTALPDSFTHVFGRAVYRNWRDG